MVKVAAASTDLATHTVELVAVGDTPSAVASDDSSRAFVANAIDRRVPSPEKFLAARTRRC
jgi:hypothetical protein